MHILKSVTIALSSALLVTACGSVPTTNDNATLTGKAKENAGKPDLRTVATVNATSTDLLNDPKGVLAKRSVYFDFDSYALKPEFNSLITAHAKYLEANKPRKVVIQGNTDEFGGTEYNLALGQKRAEAVRKALAILGVPNSQMEAISFGKEKPKALSSDEASWAQNRRADIEYSGNKVTP